MEARLAAELIVVCVGAQTRFDHLVAVGHRVVIDAAVRNRWSCELLVQVLIRYRFLFPHVLTRKCYSHSTLAASIPALVLAGVRRGELGNGQRALFVNEPEMA